MPSGTSLTPSPSSPSQMPSQAPEPVTPLRWPGALRHEIPRDLRSLGWMSEIWAPLSMSSRTERWPMLKWR